MPVSLAGAPHMPLRGGNLVDNFVLRSWKLN